MVLVQLILLPFHFLFRIAARTILLIVTLGAVLSPPILVFLAWMALGEPTEPPSRFPEGGFLIAFLGALGIFSAVLNKTWKVVRSSLSKIGKEVWRIVGSGWIPTPALDFDASLSKTRNKNIAKIFPNARRMFFSSGQLIISIFLLLALLLLAYVSTMAETNWKDGVIRSLREPPPHVVVVTPEDRITSYLLQNGTIFSLPFLSNGSPRTGEGICLTEDQKTWLSEFKKAINECAKFSDPPLRLQVTVRAYASTAPVKMEGVSSHDNAPSSDDLNCEIGNRRAEEVVNFLIHDDQKDPASFACESVGGSGDTDYRGLGECQRLKKRFEFGPNEDLGFKLVYVPWRTHEDMVENKPADDGDAETGPRRSAVEFLNRSVHLVLENDACKMETEKGPPVA